MHVSKRCGIAGFPSGLGQLGVTTGRSGDVRCTTALPLKAEVWPRVCYAAEVPKLKRSDRSRGRPRRPLPSEVVADVGVAVSGIKPQAAVKWKGLIELVDLGTGVADGWRSV